MTQTLQQKSILEQAKEYAFDYLDGVADRRVSPDMDALAGLAAFEEPMPEQPQKPEAILAQLQTYGAPATCAQGGGRYFGFVNGGITPAGLAARWMADAWDQNSALYVMSPVSSKLEELCERWLVDLLGLPEGTAAGFVSGSSTAIVCALAAARNELLARQGWNVSEQGLWGAPPIRIVLGEQAHSSVFKALALLGMGKSMVTLAPVDEQGRMLPDRLPEIDRNTLLILQAGNVNSGAFDPLDALCARAGEVGAWVHVDGAFGLWANASEQTRHLVRGVELADSWSTDAHKTLNAPYDSGIVFVKDRAALVRAMQASGSYILYSEQRDGMLYTPEMSRRARSIELWATLKGFGKSGVGELVDTLCENARYFAGRLSEHGFRIQNDVVFNQVLVGCDSAEETKSTLAHLQANGVCWCGGAVWRQEPVIRISVCSWRTTKADIDACVAGFVAARSEAKAYIG
jgi:glutamate/tyrosine decarboxylase-like PLP-dependent enzyme